MNNGWFIRKDVLEDTGSVPAAFIFSVLERMNRPCSRQEIERQVPYKRTTIREALTLLSARDLFLVIKNHEGTPFYAINYGIIEDDEVYEETETKVDDDEEEIVSE